MACILQADEFRYSDAVMEADIEFATVIFALSFAMPFIVQDLSMIAGFIDRFKFARGQFVLLGSYTYPLHARGAAVVVRNFCGAARSGACRLASSGDRDPPLFANSNDRVLSAPATIRSE